MSDTNSSQRLRENIRMLVRKLGLLDKDEAVCSGLTLTQSHVLVEVGRKTDMSVNDLAELLNLDKSTVSRVVEQLVKNNLLLRKAHECDRRFVTLELTDQGSQLYKSTEARMKEYYAGVLECLPAETQQQVIESLELLVKAVHGKCCEDIKK
ncbi:MAG: MarR family transcriptional regulator [Pelosinus sp.]|nr:MarR family transcriptional regulator [Pelosinus sp.]